VLAITQGGTKAKAMIAATIAVTNRVVLSNFIARTPMVVDLLDDDFGKQNSLSLWERVGVRVVFPRIGRPHPASKAFGFEAVPLPHRGEGF
jgi:hypothetical protein